MIADLKEEGAMGMQRTHTDCYSEVANQKRVIDAKLTYVLPDVNILERFGSLLYHSSGWG